MTLSLTRAIAPMGHVYTFEYNSTRADQSQQEFAKYSIIISNEVKSS